MARCARADAEVPLRHRRRDVAGDQVALDAPRLALGWIPEPAPAWEVERDDVAG